MNMKAISSAAQPLLPRARAPHAIKHIRTLPTRSSCMVKSLAASESSSEPSKTPVVYDRFHTAAQRLKGLLAGVGDGDGQLMDKMVSEMEVATRLQMQLSGNDPWGGATFSLETLNAFLLGALCSLPLVAVRLYCWSSEGVKAVPNLEDMHESQLEMVLPWFTNVTRLELAMMMLLDQLPLLLLVLPAAQGSITAFALSVPLVDNAGMDIDWDMADEAALSVPLVDNAGMDTDWDMAEEAALSVPPMDNAGMDMDWDMAEEAVKQSTSFAASTFLKLGALSLTALVMSAAKASELDTNTDEEEVIETAVQNADRFYRVMINNSAEAKSDASAFKAVAQAFLETKKEVAMLGSAFTALDVFALEACGEYATGNLAAPAAFALATNWVEYYSLHDIVLEKERKQARGDLSEGKDADGKNGV
eukprot:gene16721-22988_t